MRPNRAGYLARCGAPNKVAVTFSTGWTLRTCVKHGREYGALVGAAGLVDTVAVIDALAGGQQLDLPLVFEAGDPEEKQP